MPQTSVAHISVEVGVVWTFKWLVKSKVHREKGITEGSKLERLVDELDVGSIVLCLELEVL